MSDEKIDPRDLPEIVRGYRAQDPDDVNYVNVIKKLEEDIAAVWRQAPEHADKRSLALARTNLEQGFMWFVRAVFQPETRFDQHDDG